MDRLQKYYKKRKVIHPAKIHFVSATDIEHHVKQQTKKHDNVIYGARAIDIQLERPLKRDTRDWDILTKNPKKMADEMEQKLDKQSGGDFYYTQPAKHKGTIKVRDKGNDLTSKEDDFTIADYTIMPKNIDTKKIQGIRYESMKSIIKGKKHTLKLKSSQAISRGQSDRDDLKKIYTNKKLKKIIKKI